MENGVVEETKGSSEYYLNYINEKNKLLKGKGWIVNGKIYVKDEAGVIPTLQIDKIFAEKMIVKKNAEVVTDMIIDVSEDDVISVEIKNEIVPPKCLVKTDKQQLKAFIEVEPGYEITRKMKNTSPSRKVVLTLEEQRTMTEKVSIDEIKKALIEANILYGVKEEVIIVAAQTNELAVYEVATGIAPQEGQDGYLEMKVDSKIKRRLKKDEIGNIDFRDSRVIPVVEAGDILGLIHSPIPGSTGRSVTNQPIQPTPVMSITFYPDKGVKLEKNQIIATRSGRPRISQKAHIVKASVIPQFIQEGNVGLASGNIQFFGDVEVRGEVEETMLVEAGNDVFIYSSINRSTITAGNSIVSGGNVANSILSVGEKNADILQLSYYLGSLTGQLESIHELLEQITHSAAYKNSEPQQSLRTIFQFLLRHRFNTFTEKAKNYTQLVSQEKDFLSPEWEEAAEQLKYLLFTITQLDLTLTQIKILIDLMHDIQDISLFDFEESRLIDVSSVANSTLICNGDIQVIGQGCLNSALKAQGKVSITGYLRGGIVTAKDDIEANIVGTVAGIKTILSAPSGNTIRIERAYEGTELRVGRNQVTLTKEYSGITAHLNEEGVLMLK